MSSQIIALNIGHPQNLEWKGRNIISSMAKESVPGPIDVHMDRIEGNTFHQPIYHGTPDSVLYAYGMSSALEFVKILGLREYVPGTTGETVTLDVLDEKSVSVGDIFKFGEVIAQATYPRIPCGKVNFRMQHELGQKAMIDCGRSGIYFRILKPGKIHLSDKVSLFEKAQDPFSIFELYALLNQKIPLTSELSAKAKKNGAIPERLFNKIFKA